MKRTMCASILVLLSSVVNGAPQENNNYETSVPRARQSSVCFVFCDFPPTPASKTEEIGFKAETTVPIIVKTPSVGDIIMAFISSLFYGTTSDLLINILPKGSPMRRNYGSANLQEEANIRDTDRPSLTISLEICSGLTRASHLTDSQGRPGLFSPSICLPDSPRHCFATIDPIGLP